MYKAPNRKYLEQWERVKRWYKKIKDIEEGTVEESDDELRDQVYAFFINCYHLKDWVKNTTNRNPEKLFDKNNGLECFKVCADFVNYSKHLTLVNNVRVDPNSDISQQGVKISLGKDLGVLKTQYNWKIKSNRREIDVFYLATDCMSEWEKFLNKHKLL
jgi:hypothetical protein